MFEKVVFSLVPRPLTTAMIATEMPRLCAILYTYEYNDVFSSRRELDQEPP